MAKKSFRRGFLLTALILAVVFIGCASAPSVSTSTFEGFWTRYDLSDSDPVPPEDWNFLADGSLVIIHLGTKNHSWKQEKNTIVIKINGGFAAYTLQIIDANLVKGTAVNMNNDEWPVELRKIQNPVTLKNKSDGTLAVFGVDSCFILDTATRLYEGLSEEQEASFMVYYMVGDDGRINVSNDESVYEDLFKYYEDDIALWDFDISLKKGSIYIVEFYRNGKEYYGIAANLSFLDEIRFYVIPLENVKKP
jgi:hypothetical protein